MVVPHELNCIFAGDKKNILFLLNGIAMKTTTLSQFIKVHAETPELRKIRQIVDILRDGGVIIYPTDTVYGLGCDIFNKSAVERICRIKGIKTDKANFSFICYDLSHLSEFTRNVSTPIYKVMRKSLPGPYTFILNASSKVPKEINAKRKTVGIRVPDNNIIRAIVQELGNPILSTSIKTSDEILEYLTDPTDIYEEFNKLVDVVIDGGNSGNIPSTVIDCTNEEFEIVREGLGSIEHIF